jgi:hypothetical protein
MLAKRVLAVILKTIIALSLRITSGSIIIISALRELIVKSKKIVVIRGVKLLKRGEARGRGRKGARF